MWSCLASGRTLTFVSVALVLIAVISIVVSLEREEHKQGDGSISYLRSLSEGQQQGPAFPLPVSCSIAGNTSCPFYLGWGFMETIGGNAARYGHHYVKPDHSLSKTCIESVLFALAWASIGSIVALVENVADFIGLWFAQEQSTRSFVMTFISSVLGAFAFGVFVEDMVAKIGFELTAIGYGIIHLLSYSQSIMSICQDCSS
jgi:hypothetical protein